MPVCVVPGLSQHAFHTDMGMVHFLSTLNPAHLLHLLLSSECTDLPQLSCLVRNPVTCLASRDGGSPAPLISSVVAGWHSGSHQLLSLSEWISPKD